jgi:hypothetical protein
MRDNHSSSQYIRFELVAPNPKRMKIVLLVADYLDKGLWQRLSCLTGHQQIKTPRKAWTELPKQGANGTDCHERKTLLRGKYKLLQA